VCFVDTSSLQPAHKNGNSVVTFSAKTSDANYTNLTTFDSVKMEGELREPVGSRGGALRVADSALYAAHDPKISFEQSVAENEQE